MDNIMYCKYITKVVQPTKQCLEFGQLRELAETNSLLTSRTMLSSSEGSNPSLPARFGLVHMIILNTSERITLRIRQLWFVYYNSERNLVVRMKISKNRHKCIGLLNQTALVSALKAGGTVKRMAVGTSATRSK